MIVRAVIDLMGGVVVRGVRGQRELYRPIESKLTRSTTPRDIALAIHEATGIRDFYIADLDAIQKGTDPDWDLMAWIQGKGWSLWLDSGLKTGKELVHWPVELARPVIGTETFEETPEGILQKTAIHPVLSVDLLKGQIIGQGQFFFRNTHSLVNKWLSCDIQDFIWMDLYRVGSLEGPIDPKEGEDLKKLLEKQVPRVHAAGGIRNHTDLESLQKAGFAGALIASAIHKKNFYH